MIAKVATIEPWSNDCCKLVLEKCWKAKYTAINNETTAPSLVCLTKKDVEEFYFTFLQTVEEATAQSPKTYGLAYLNFIAS